MQIYKLNFSYEHLKLQTGIAISHKKGHNGNFTLTSGTFCTFYILLKSPP